MSRCSFDPETIEGARDSVSAALIEWFDPRLADGLDVTEAGVIAENLVAVFLDQVDKQNKRTL